jgi:hypothetical protein
LLKKEPDLGRKMKANSNLGQWCVSCTQWKEANEPGVTPAAPPNNLLSPDEEREVVETNAGFGAYATDDIEGEADSEVSVIISKGQVRC